jgi:ADP-ribose pyrophosphatase YjhB (NUDIX family)
VVLRGLRQGAGEVLLVKRGTPPLLGRWSLPGGVLELGETLSEGIVREVFEETALRITPLAVVESFDRIHRDALGRVQFHYVLVDFLCRYDGGEIAIGDDAAEGCWAARADVSTGGPYQLEPLTCEVIEKAFAMGETLEL